MTLNLSLVINGDQTGAEKALKDTATGIDELGGKAREAAKPISDMGSGLDDIAKSAPEAAKGVKDIGEAAASSGSKIVNMKDLALGAIGGLAGGIAAQTLDAVFGTLTKAASDYFQELTNGPANVKADLDAHRDLVAQVKGLWSGAKDAASDYGSVSAATLKVQARGNVNRLDSDFASSLGGLQNGDILNQGGIGTASTNARAPFQDAIAKLRTDLKDGKADIVSFREEIATIADALPAGEQFDFATKILGDTEKAAQLQTELNRAVDLYKGLQGDADAAIAAVGKAGEAAAATGAKANGALPAMREYSELLGKMGNVPVVTLPDGSTVSGAAGTVGGGFAAGGYTGHLPTDRVAGFVHGQEYVFDAAATARIGVGNLEAIRKGVAGYAAGGAVGRIGSSSGSGSGLDGSSGTALASTFDLLRGVAGDLAQALKGVQSPAEAAANVLGNLLNKLLSGAGTAFDTANPALGGIGSGIASVLGSLFGGFRASGGDTSAGRLYMVGERGPELFAPGTSGSIIPNSALGGEVKFNQTIINQNGSDVRSRQTRRQDGSVYQELVIGATQQGMEDGRYRAFGIRGQTKSR